jgi:hypothetical protein
LCSLDVSPNLPYFFSMVREKSFLLHTQMDEMGFLLRDVVLREAYRPPVRSVILIGANLMIVQGLEGFLIVGT